MLKIIKTFGLLCAVLILALISFSCSCGCSKNNEIVIRPDIIKNADSFIISKTSKDFFDKYVTLDMHNSAQNQSGYSFAYKLQIPEKPFVDGLIQFYTDTAGNALTDKSVSGLPDCVENPAECSFAIDGVKAAEIAKAAGLEPGIKDWRKMFVWSDNFKTYTWVIISTYEKGTADSGFKEKGREVIISSSSGKVLQNKEWAIR